MKVRKQSREGGLQLAELAILLPVVLALLAAIAEFGNYFYYFSTLSKATRAGARYISSKPYITDEINRAKDLMVCGNINGCQSSTPILPGFSASNIQITANGGTMFLPNTVTVNIIGYNYNSIFDLNKVAKAGSWTSIPVDASTTMRYLLEN
jgi:Flp pilus assembly protein TadG